ncbi:hypothetical protein Droror1_Dr00023512 [Drosera rotundifolia]
MSWKWRQKLRILMMKHRPSILRSRCFIVLPIFVGLVQQGIHSNTDDPGEHVDDLSGLKTEKKEADSQVPCSVPCFLHSADSCGFLVLITLAAGRNATLHQK